MKLGMSTYAWYDFPFSKMIPLLAETGYSAISLGSRKEHTHYHTEEGRKRIRQILSDHDMELESVHAPAGIREGRLIDISDPDPTHRAHAITETKHAIHAAAECGAAYVVIHPIGVKWRKGFNLSERSASAFQSLEQLQSYAETHGVKMALENLDPPEDRMFRAIYQQVIELGMVYCYDNGHAFVDQDPSAIWKLMAPFVRTLHLHDNNGRKDTHDQLGTGQFPWQELRQWLKDSNYQGVIGLECRFRGQEESEFKTWLLANRQFVHGHFQ